MMTPLPPPSTDLKSTPGNPQFDENPPKSDRPPLRAAYFQRLRNVGDAIAPCLLEGVTGRRTVRARSTDLSYVLSIGSLLQTSTPQSFVWGTGLIHPTAGIGRPCADRILAVRGKLTYAELVRNGIRVRDIPLGDPGSLIQRFLRDGAAELPRFRLGLVPHVFDRNHPFFLKAAEDPTIRVLNVCGPVEAFFADMMSCTAIASTSLHGLIFGEALGLPTLWLEVSNKVLGHGFKFADWFSLARNPQRTPLRPKRFASMLDIFNQCEPRLIDIDAPALLRAITPEIVEECSRGHYERKMLPVSVCRLRPLPVFVICRNNHECIRRTISSYRQVKRAVEIVIYDDGSCCKETLDFLDEMERDGLTVFRADPTGAADRLHRLNGAIEEFFKTWAEPSRFVVTDGSVDPSKFANDALAFYDDLLDAFPRADNVGPAQADTPAPFIVRFVRTVVNRGVPRSVDGGVSGTTACRCILRKRMPFDSSFSMYRAAGLLAPSATSLRVIDARQL